jgi:DNA-binding protein HU-beta
LGLAKGFFMSKAFISENIRQSLEITGVSANRATHALLGAIIRELKKSGKFTLSGFGTFTVHKLKARKALNPRTGEPIKVKAGKTVRFKASPVLKNAV